jgi:hypothetical protein
MFSTSIWRRAVREPCTSNTREFYLLHTCLEPGTNVCRLLEPNELTSSTSQDLAD